MREPRLYGPPLCTALLRHGSASLWRWGLHPGPGPYSAGVCAERTERAAEERDRERLHAHHLGDENRRLRLGKLGGGVSSHSADIQTRVISAMSSQPGTEKVRGWRLGDLQMKGAWCVTAQPHSHIAVFVWVNVTGETSSHSAEIQKSTRKGRCTLGARKCPGHACSDAGARPSI